MSENLDKIYAKMKEMHDSFCDIEAAFYFVRRIKLCFAEVAPTVCECLEKSYAARAARVFENINIAKYRNICNAIDKNPAEYSSIVIVDNDEYDIMEHVSEVDAEIDDISSKVASSVLPDEAEMRHVLENYGQLWFNVYSNIFRSNKYSFPVNKYNVNYKNTYYNKIFTECGSIGYMIESWKLGKKADMDEETLRKIRENEECDMELLDNGVDNFEKFLREERASWEPVGKEDESEELVDLIGLEPVEE